MLRARRHRDVVREWVRQQRATVGVLQLHREFETVAGPGNRNPESQPDGQAGMSGRKSLNPKRVPSSAQDEQLAPHRLYRVCEKRHVDAGT